MVGVVPPLCVLERRGDVLGKDWCFAIMAIFCRRAVRRERIIVKTSMMLDEIDGGIKNDHRLSEMYL